jgi:hypothetical protein
MFSLQQSIHNSMSVTFFSSLQHNENEDNYFMQDGATAHNAVYSCNPHTQ